MMNLLWITRQDPRTADSGELIYTRGLLRSLAAQNKIALHVLAHRAGTAAPDPDAGDPIHWHLPAPMPDKRARSVISRLPSDAARLGNPAMRMALRKLLAGKRWDWVVIDQAACGWVLDEILDLPATTRTAYVAHNHEASVRPMVAAEQRGALPIQMALRHDAAKYARLERFIVTRADLVTAITPRDRAAFLHEFPGKNIVVLPPGYDGNIPTGDLPPLTHDTPRRVVLAGAFQWIAKRRNLENFLAAAAEPFLNAGIEFIVVGKANPTYFEKLSRQHPWVRFHPNVASMEPWLAHARAGLIPESLGGGFKLKALDYIFRGLPVASVESALSGLPPAPGSDAITGTAAEDLARAVAERINDIKFLNLAARSALAKCRHAFHWKDRGNALAEALDTTPSSKAKAQSSASSRTQPFEHNTQTIP